MHPFRFIFQLLDEIAEETELLPGPAVGDPCVTDYEGGLYRAEVLAVQGSDITVRFVDFGNDQLKSPAQLFVVSPSTQPQVNYY